jgi:hypothetical protein
VVLYRILDISSQVLADDAFITYTYLAQFHIHIIHVCERAETSSQSNLYLRKGGVRFSMYSFSTEDGLIACVNTP